MSLFPLYFWRIVLSDIKFMLDIFSPALEKCFTSFLPPWFQTWSLRNLLSFKLVFSICNVISLWLLLIFFFVFSFRSLIMMCLSIDFLGFSSFRIHSAFWICGFMLFLMTKFGDFSAIFSWTTFSHSLHPLEVLQWYQH